MARSRVLQASIKGKLETDFDTYQEREKLTDAEAVRELLSFALRIKLNDSDNDRPSNRELMEEIYRRIRQTQGTVNLDYTQGFDGEAFYRNKPEANEMRNIVMTDVNNKVDSFLEGKKKG